MTEQICMIEVRDEKRIYAWNSVGFTTGPWSLANGSLSGEDYEPVPVSTQMREEIEKASAKAEFPAYIPFVWEGDTIGVDCLRADALQQASGLREFAQWAVSLDDPEGPGFEARKAVSMNQIITKAREALGLPDEF